MMMILEVSGSEVDGLGRDAPGRLDEDLDHQSSRIHRGVPNPRVSSSVINYRPKLRGPSSVSVGDGFWGQSDLLAHCLRTRSQANARCSEVPGRFMISHKGQRRLIRGPVICRADWELGLGSWLQAVSRDPHHLTDLP